MSGGLSLDITALGDKLIHKFPAALAVHASHSNNIARN
jgi:hypothetical protein